MDGKMLIDIFYLLLGMRALGFKGFYLNVIGKDC